MRKKVGWTALVGVLLLTLSILPAAWAQRDRVYRQPPLITAGESQIEILEDTIPLRDMPQVELESWLWNGFVWLAISLVGAVATYQIQKKREGRNK